MVSSTPRPHFTPGKDPVPILQEAGWAPRVTFHIVLFYLKTRSISDLALIPSSGGKENYETCVPLRRQTTASASDHAVGLYWVPGHAGVRGNEIADKLARSGSAQRFVGPEPFWGVSRQNIRRNLNRWMGKQHLALRRGTCNTQRQARELISGSGSGYRGPAIVP